jgi:hypothetical protein
LAKPGSPRCIPLSRLSAEIPTANASMHFLTSCAVGPAEPRAPLRRLTGPNGLVSRIRRHFSDFVAEWLRQSWRPLQATRVFPIANAPDKLRHLENFASPLSHCLFFHHTHRLFNFSATIKRMRTTMTLIHRRPMRSLICQCLVCAVPCNHLPDSTL